jgi:hypothetical protein
MSGVPTIVVCAVCRAREVHGAAAGLPSAPYTDWPVTLDRLLLEDKARLRYQREHGVGELIRDRRRRARANQGR